MTEKRYHLQNEEGRSTADLANNCDGYHRGVDLVGVPLGHIIMQTISDFASMTTGRKTTRRMPFGRDQLWLNC